MSRNRRRSLPSSLDEDKTPAAQPSGSSLRSQSLSRLECSVQASSIYQYDTRNTRPQVVSVANGTDRTEILNGSTSVLSLGQAQWSELPFRRFPHILVAASKEPETSDSKPASSSRTPIEPISEVPFVEPSKTPPVDRWSRAPSLRQSSFAYRDNEDESSVSEDEVSPVQSFTSYTDEYDRGEPLITKTEKFYKKRASLIPKYDSEDSYVIARESYQKDTAITFNTTTIQLTDSTGSFSEYDADIRMNQSWDIDSGVSKESYDLSRGGKRLGSGMVFIYMVIPPDGGFGWVIMVLSFLAQLIIDGLIFTIGILLPSIAKDLGVSTSSVSFVASVQIGCYFTSGAFSAVLINRFGFRKVAIAGVLCSATTILASSWSVSLTMLIFFYSVLGGFTLSMIWASSQLIVGYYFERYRPMANGFSCSGGGAGIVVFTFLNSWLVPIIGWRNMLRTQAGLIMLILLMVVAYVEVAPTQVGLYHFPDNLESSSDEYYGNFYVHDYLRLSTQNGESRSALNAYDPPPKRHWCTKFCPCCTNCCCGKRRKKPQNEDELNLLIRPAPLEREDLFYTGPAEYEKPQSKENLEGKEFQLMGSDKNTQQVKYGIKNINLGDEGDGTSREPKGNHNEARWSNEVPKKPNACGNSRFMLTLLKLFDYHLLKQFEFQILVASAFLYPMGFNIPFVYSSARTTIPVKYARMIGPIIGISNLVLRNILGFLAYKRRTWTLGLCGCGLVFGGFSVFISAFYGQNLIWFQFLYGISYAVAPAVFSTLRGLIYVKYLGLSKLTNAFGITSLAMGMGAFIGTTIAGKMVGSTGNYSAAFCFAGLCLIISGILKLMLPGLIKFRNRKAQ
ncbi:uncharacterized protein Dere_GG20472 [Drosophila erecta]|uniref:Major facilitator superfamily (MFS) profile domain-containing protein n=1 Tax=Drosophila erecta TaxID=7220 RepID=B3NQU1_DROER|nr:uncharacterized protein Dere_GG20472 [Drosophila erecta]